MPLLRRGGASPARPIPPVRRGRPTAAPLEDVFAYSNGAGADRSVVVYHNRFGEAAGWIRESVPFAVKHDDGTKATRTDRLAEALELPGPDEGWLRFRDQRAGLESLRSVGELRARGLFVDLGAYECFVLDDLREVVSTAEQPWTGLAGELAGRAAPSLDDALADHRLRPIHAAIGRLLVAMTGDEIGTARAGLAEASGLTLQRRPAPAPTRPRAAGAGPVDPAARAADRLRPLTRAAFDELRVATPLRSAGLDRAAIERVRVGLELLTPASLPDAAGLGTAWLADPEVRAFLQVHEWDGVEWLVRDRWVALVDLAAGLDQLVGRRVSPTILKKLRGAAQVALDRVDAIVPALTASRRPRGARRPRTGGTGSAAT